MNKTITHLFLQDITSRLPPNAIVMCDLDGTLIDTEYANNLSYADAIRVVTNGLCELQVAPGQRFIRGHLKTHFPQLSDGDRDRIIALKEATFTSYLQLTNLNTALAAILTDLSRSAELVLVTSARQDRANRVLNYHGMIGHFRRTLYLGGSCNEPASNKYECAMIQLGADPLTVLVFENDRRDVELAMLAGVPRRNIFSI